MVLFFIADNQCKYFATFKPQLKDITSLQSRSVQHKCLHKPGSL